MLAAIAQVAGQPAFTSAPFVFRTRPGRPRSGNPIARRRSSSVKFVFVRLPSPCLCHSLASLVAGGLGQRVAIDGNR